MNEDIATEKQKKFLRKLGIDFNDDITKKEASALIDAKTGFSKESRPVKVVANEQQDLWISVRDSILKNIKQTEQLKEIKEAFLQKAEEMIRKYKASEMPGYI